MLSFITIKDNTAMKDSTAMKDNTMMKNSTMMKDNTVVNHGSPVHYELGIPLKIVQYQTCLLYDKLLLSYDVI